MSVLLMIGAGKSVVIEDQPAISLDGPEMCSGRDVTGRHLGTQTIDGREICHVAIEVERAIQRQGEFSLIGALGAVDFSAGSDGVTLDGRDLFAERNATAAPNRVNHVAAHAEKIGPRPNGDLGGRILGAKPRRDLFIFEERLIPLNPV